jgi:hypothetical protein
MQNKPAVFSNNNEQLDSASTAVQKSTEQKLGGLLKGSNVSDLLTERDVAQKLNLSLASLRRWRLEQRGPLFMKIGSLVRYRPEDLASWISALPKGGAQPETGGAALGTRRIRATNSSFRYRPL